MNLTKYITINLITKLSLIALVAIIYSVICVELDLNLPLISEDILSNFHSLFFQITIFLQLLFFVEVIVREKYPQLLPILRKQNNFELVLFYIGYIFALLNIIGTFALFFAFRK